VRVVLFGPPGAGKGTQGHRLAERFGARMIATGDIFRANLRDETPLGLKAKSYMDAGELVPDDIVIGMLKEELREAGDAFVLDGFPRTPAQAQALEEAVAEMGARLDAALKFDVPDGVVIRRLAGRRTCARCQRTFNVELQPPREPGVCDACGGELVQREDDREETVRRRIDVYHQETEPLEDFYRQRGLLRDVDAQGDVEEVNRRAIAALSEDPA
jgi:adenylate kinase